MDALQLRTFCYLDRLQPRYAAFLGTVVQGDMPVVGMASLFVEVAPGNEIFRLTDIALKAAAVRPAAQVVEREFGLLEVHAYSQPEVRKAGEALLAHLGCTEQDRITPQIVSRQMIERIDAYQSQLLNRFRRGGTIISRETMLVLECAPAAYANYLTNEIEKQADIEIVHVTGLGRFGRLWLAGTKAEMEKASEAADMAVEELKPKT